MPAQTDSPPRDFLPLQDPANMRRANKAELDLHADQSKKMLYAEKESLFFAMDEKSHEADLTEKGRMFLSPSDPDAFVVATAGLCEATCTRSNPMASPIIG